MRQPIRIKHQIERLASHSGLIHIGALLDKMNLKERLNNLVGVSCRDPKFSNADILFSMIALITIGKPDYDAIEIFREKQEFFTKAMRISECPSSPTIRQRIDLIGDAANMLLKEEILNLIKNMAPSITPLDTNIGQFIPMDIDVSPFDNSKTMKEGVSRTYKGYDGYAPIFAYLGTEGYLINLELREGKQHCQKNTPQFIEETIKYARQITDRSILMRLDSGNDSQDNFPNPADNIHFIIKRNLRKESLLAWASLAKKNGKEQFSRDGKTVWIGKTFVDLQGKPLPYPIVFEVTERRTKKNEILLFPEYQVDTYWCSLNELSAQETIFLYHDHGTSEQFHSEIKSDLGLERLPSGKFESNSLILHIGMMAYNMLRIIGQMSLEEGGRNSFRSKKVKRRRIRTVMQDLMYMAGRLITTGRKWYISFGQLNPFAQIAERIYDRICKKPILV